MDESPITHVHSNFVAAHGGPFDIAMDFGYRLGEESPDVEVRVTMSWEHLKVLLATLNALVDNYEATVGVIPNLVKKPEAIEKEQAS